MRCWGRRRRPRRPLDLPREVAEALTAAVARHAEAQVQQPERAEVPVQPSLVVVEHGPLGARGGAWATAGGATKGSQAQQWDARRCPSSHRRRGGVVRFGGGAGIVAPGDGVSQYRVSSVRAGCERCKFCFRQLRTCRRTVLAGQRHKIDGAGV